MRAWIFFLAALLASAAGAQQAQTLRVCADPDNLPYSHENRTGFENRIADLVAADFGLQVEYAWLPDRRGFVRKTMGAGLCDLIVGVPTGFERTLNTKPYYRSSYVLLDKAGGALVQDFDDPRLRQWRIGVQLIGDDMATSPPGHALVQAGAVDNVVGFPIPGEQPAAARMVQALTRGDLDAAFIWGPQAGYYARQAQLQGQQRLRMQVVPAPSKAATQQFEFEIAMGVRRGDTALRDRLDELLVRRRADIERILANYGVPLLELEER